MAGHGSLASPPAAACGHGNQRFFKDNRINIESIRTSRRCDVSWRIVQKIGLVHLFHNFVKEGIEKGP